MWGGGGLLVPCKWREGGTGTHTHVHNNKWSGGGGGGGIMFVSGG